MKGGGILLVKMRSITCKDQRLEHGLPALGQGQLSPGEVAPVSGLLRGTVVPIQYVERREEP